MLPEIGYHLLRKSTSDFGRSETSAQRALLLLFIVVVGGGGVVLVPLFVVLLVVVLLLVFSILLAALSRKDPRLHMIVRLRALRSSSPSPSAAHPRCS